MLSIKPFLLAAVSVLLTASVSADSAKTIIVLDASGSMWGQVDGIPKIEIARDTVSDLLTTLNPDLELGLMAYGHRTKGDCEDIELLVAPAKIDKTAFLSQVNSIIPKGKTPLTAAVEQAADILKYEENKANVILVSDGIETCDGDPTALARKLKEAGIDFKAHIVAFDLTAEEANSFRVLADETGGEFLQARNAATLKDALEIAVEAATSEQKAMPEPDLSPATVTCPATVPAGAEFEAGWEGPGQNGDYLTIVPVGADVGAYDNYAYTRSGNPVSITAPIEPGNYEVRYMPKGSKQVLGSTPVEVIKAEAIVTGPAEAVASSFVNVEWEGPDNKGDYLTIVSAGAEESTYESYAYTRDGSPLKVRALSTPGDAEIRYVTGQGGKTLASATIKILEADVLVSGPEAVEAGQPVEVEWKGPGNKGDYVTIVKADTDAGTYNGYEYTEGKAGQKLTVDAPEEAGDNYEIRYVDGQDAKTLATSPLVIRPASASVNGPESAVSGGTIDVEWFGPKYKGYYVTVVAKEAEDGKYEKYFYTANSESPSKLQVPEMVGEGEIRFVSRDGNVLARSPIQLTEATAEFTEAAEKVAASGKFQVKWTGPNNPEDYVTIVKPDAAAGEYNAYIYTERGTDQSLTAPEEPGQYELRYITGGKTEILARKAIEVVSE